MKTSDRSILQSHYDVNEHHHKHLRHVFSVIGELCLHPPHTFYIPLGPSCLAEPYILKNLVRWYYKINSLENYFSYYSLTSHRQ